jgi:hypothetical protein
MARNIDLRQHSHTSQGRILNQVSDLCLRQKLAVLGQQFRMTYRLDREPTIVSKMQVKHIELRSRHRIHCLLQKR